MYRTFSLKGTKEGLLLSVNETVDYNLLYCEIEECFSCSQKNFFPISYVEIKGEDLPPEIISTVEHLIKKCSGSRIIIKEAEEKGGVSLISTIRSGENVEINLPLLIRGSVNSGAFLNAGKGAVILENLFGTVAVPKGEKIYVGKSLNGQVRIGENIYILSKRKENGIWIYEENEILILEDNGGNLIDGRSICSDIR